jgi:arginine/lysine/ornithine decarboxylase
MAAGEALRLPGRQVGYADSVGKLSRGYLWAYPPGIPLVTPGVRITREVADCLARLTERGVTLQSTFPTAPGLIEIIDKT